MFYDDIRLITHYMNTNNSLIRKPESLFVWDLPTVLSFLDQDQHKAAKLTGQPTLISNQKYNSQRPAHIFLTETPSHLRTCFCGSFSPLVINFKHWKVVYTYLLQEPRKSGTTLAFLHTSFFYITIY